MSSPPTKAHRKNVDIEALRAFAILFTMVLHLRVLLPPGSSVHTLLQYMDLGVGVDLFLVISGFVITGSLLDSTHDFHAPRRVLMFSFWIKRIFRLLPAAWTWVLIACLCQLLITLVTDVHYDLADTLLRSAAALANVMNIYTPYCFANGGGDACILDNFIGHYWSLSLEEQFYLVFPLLFFFMGRRVLVAVLIIAIIVQFYWQRPFFSYPWYFKTDALCWGILLALAAKQGLLSGLRPAVLNSGLLAALLGLLLLFALPLIAAHIQGIASQMKPYGVAVVALLCAIIVWLATYDEGVFCLGRRYGQLMLYLGSRSYSLYLCHLVVYLSLRDLVGYYSPGLALQLGRGGHAMLLIVTAVGITLACSELTYRYIETVFRARGRKLAVRVARGGEQSQPPSTL